MFPNPAPKGKSCRVFGTPTGQTHETYLNDSSTIPLRLPYGVVKIHEDCLHSFVLYSDHAKPHIVKQTRGAMPRNANPEPNHWILGPPPIDVPRCPYIPLYAPIYPYLLVKPPSFQREKFVIPTSLKETLTT